MKNLKSFINKIMMRKKSFLNMVLSVTISTIILNLSILPLNALNMYKTLGNFTSSESSSTLKKVGVTAIVAGGGALTLYSSYKIFNEMNRNAPKLSQGQDSKEDNQENVSEKNSVLVPGIKFLKNTCKGWENYYGYIIYNYTEFENWKENNNISDEEKKKIYDCQNHWFEYKDNINPKNMSKKIYDVISIIHNNTEKYNKEKEKENIVEISNVQKKIGGILGILGIWSNYQIFSEVKEVKDNIEIENNKKYNSIINNVFSKGYRVSFLEI